MAYNTTPIEQANDPYDIYAAINYLSNHILAIGTLIALFIILFMAFKKYDKDTKECMLASSIITAVIGIIFWVLKLIEWKIVIWPIIVMVAAILIYKFTD